ncbi:MAG: ABC transporter ATP-binding protein [Chloroflexi bacterium]|nr:MAG: ABC transporter ATP-binding protein [Chloroflexota bacterium]
MLKVDNVSKLYRVGAFGEKTLRAVHKVSFDIQKGEVVSLIGESGSGKTTIGRMVLRLLPISSGAIWFNDMNVATLKGQALKEYYRKVQGVFQDPFSTFNPIFKADRVFRLVKEEFFPTISSGEWQNKVEQALDAVGLNPGQVLNKFPHQLSGGQLQRFLIARALLLDIELLVADEIISMLDASTRIDVLNLLGELKKTGLSILFVTHDLSLGYYISDKAVILYKGHVVEQGSTDRIFGNPLHPYTQMLMASVPRLDAKWEEELPPANGQENGADAGLTGCVYYGRCPVADLSLGCAQRQPDLQEIAPDHKVACFHYPGLE